MLNVILLHLTMPMLLSWSLRELECFYFHFQLLSTLKLFMVVLKQDQ